MVRQPPASLWPRALSWS